MPLPREAGLWGRTGPESGFCSASAINPKKILHCLGLLFIYQETKVGTRPPSFPELASERDSVLIKLLAPRQPRGRAQMHIHWLTEKREMFLAQGTTRQYSIALSIFSCGRAQF